MQQLPRNSGENAGFVRATAAGLRLLLRVADPLAIRCRGVNDIIGDESRGRTRSGLTDRADGALRFLSSLRCGLLSPSALRQVISRTTGCSAAPRAPLAKG